MIFGAVTQVYFPNVFLRVDNLLADTPIHIKIEGLNLAGSIKLKTCLGILGDLERRGVLKRSSEIIESSSGNLGVAMALACAEKGYAFTCVIDPNISPSTERIMAALGARVIKVTECDRVGGYLQTRLDLIQRMVDANPGLVWTNQYANPANVRAHFDTTGPEILREFPRLDWLFVGTGTTGTAMGCAKYLREHSPRTRIVGVDALGSVTFGGTPAKRYLPGIGTSRRPEIADITRLDAVDSVPEVQAIAACRFMASRYGLLLGASSGSVVAAILRRAHEIEPQSVVVAVSPDLGDRYLDTLYDRAWVAERFGEIPQTIQPLEEAPAVRTVA